jgi:hypothetical protein
MRALKLVQHMKNNANQMAEAVVQKTRSSEKCIELLLRVSVEEQKQCSLEIYRDLTDWLATEPDSKIEERYVALGTRRARQGVPLSNLYWAVCIANEHLSEYMQQECLLEEPVEFWGGVMLLRSLNRFFDRISYFTIVGYQKAGKEDLAGAPAAFAQR